MSGTIPKTYTYETFANSTTNTALGDNQVKIKKLIKAGLNRKEAIKSVISVNGKYSEDEMSKYEELLDTEGDEEIHEKKPVKLIDLPSQMIFKAGTWTGSDGKPRLTTKKQLESAVKAYNETKDTYQPIQKLTHMEKHEHSNHPVMKTFPFRVGTHANLRMVGDELWSERKSVPEPIVKLMKDKIITGHSAEFKHDVLINGKKYERYLVADAFLSAHRPALASVMEPFKYEESDDNSDLTILDVEFGETIYYAEEPISFEYNDNLKEIEEMQLTKAQYAAAIKAKGIKTTYEEYSAMSEADQKKVLPDDSAVDGEPEPDEDDAPAPKSKAKATYSDDTIARENQSLKEQLRKYEEKATRKAEADSKAKYEEKLEKQQEELNELKLKYAEQELAKEAEENKKFVYSFTKAQNGPVFPISMEKKLIDMFNNMDKPEADKVSYSEGDKTVEGTVKSNVQTVLTQLGRELKAVMPRIPSGKGINNNNKSVYSTEEVGENVRGKENQPKYSQTKGIEFLGDKAYYADDETMEYLDDDEQIQKYADDNKVSYEQAFDWYYGTSQGGSLSPEAAKGFKTVGV